MQGLAVPHSVSLHSSSISSALFLTYTAPPSYFKLFIYLLLILCRFHVLLGGLLGKTEELEGRQEPVRLLRGVSLRGAALQLCYLSLPRQVAVMQSLFHI